MWRLKPATKPECDHMIFGDEKKETGKHIVILTIIPINICRLYFEVALNQLVVLFTGRPVQVAMVMLLASTGLVIGNSSSLLVRFYRMRSRVMGGS